MLAMAHFQQVQKVLKIEGQHLTRSESIIFWQFIDKKIGIFYGGGALKKITSAVGSQIEQAIFYFLANFLEKSW
jgi:hypothetical protein